MKYDYSKKYFENMSSGWNSISFNLISSFVREGMAHFYPKTVLDVGCGNGIYGPVLRENSAVLFGIDMAREALELCKFAGYDHVIQCLAERIEFEDEKFDMVFSSEVLEHIEDYEQVLGEICRVLKPGGGMVLTTTCYSTSIYQFLLHRKKGGPRELATNLVRYVKGFFNEKDRAPFVREWCFEPLGGHYHGFIPRKLKKRVESIGFDVLKISVFYAIEPFPLVQGYTFKQCLFEFGRSWPKRIVLLCLLLFAPPFNLAAKMLRLFGNNVVIIARKK